MAPGGNFGAQEAAALVSELRQTYLSGRTRSLAWRKEQLKALLTMTDKHEAEIKDALYADIGKPRYESFFMELVVTINEIKDALKNLHRWVAKVPTAVPLVTAPGKAYTIPEPLGVTLVISAWNFPYMLATQPVVGALAAGNCVVLKPSELAPATSALLARLIPLYLDPSAVRVVEGAIPATTALLEQRWDKIFYTGSGNVGRIVLAAAAKNLTPVTLELGGKSPTIVDSTADLKVAAKRILVFKLSNAGQVCVSPDYALVEESVANKFVEILKETIEEFLGPDPQKSVDYGRIGNERQWQRLNGLLEDPGVKPRIVFGGARDLGTKYMGPTLVRDAPWESALMNEEIFGPILPIQTYSKLEDAMEKILAKPKPLALYLFTTRKEVKDRVVAELPAGGICINDTVLHCTVLGLPFGGVGESGMGAYHGKHSFDCFSHMKAVLDRPANQGDVSFRYPPYTARKQKFIVCLLRGDFLGVLAALLNVRG